MTLTNTDCILAGGGLVGLLTARALVMAGLSVSVLERGELCRESSWAGGGILSPLVPWEYPAPVSELARWSQQAYPQLTAELFEATGIDPEWTRSGMLLAGYESGAASRDWAARYGASLEMLDAGSISALEPALAPLSSSALWLPEVAQIRNPRLGKALIEELRQRGVALHEHCAVNRLRVRQGRVTGVETAAGELSARYVVIASGAWSPQLLTTGAPLPVRPVRGQMIQFQAPPGLLRHIVMYDGRYLIPRRDGLVLAGSTLEEVGYCSDVTAGARAELCRAAFGMLPALADCPLVRHWAGLRPGSPEGVPFICEHSEISGLFLNTGHYRNGVILGPASAQLLADCLLGRPGFTDMAPFRYRRT